MPHRIGLVGLGQIARKQHLPAIAADPDFTLAAIATHDGEPPPGIPRYPDHAAMLAAHPEIDAVVICTPPRAHHSIAADALRAGRHVLLEKPPAATLGELADLESVARAAGRVLFATWHSQHNAAVDRLAAHLRGRRLARLHMEWKENFHHFHPGQRWVWQAGGFGVFDMAINGLSILARLLDPAPFFTAADLRVPENTETPIAAEVRLATPDGTPLTAGFDWDWAKAPVREIHGATDDGTTFALTDSGCRLAIDGAEVLAHERAEYPALYRRFAALLAANRSEIDPVPLRLVADILLQGRHTTVAPVVL
jgi:D-galactose 1-dehydrogenase